METLNERLNRIDFSRCLIPCDSERMDKSFIQRLVDIQNMIRKPLLINTGYRSVDYEKEKGRSGNSVHCEGRAVDVHCTDSRERYSIVNAAICAGIISIGIYKSFIHLDCGENRSSQLLWLGTY